MMNLAKATILSLMYFELCEDEELNPDIALKMSESILAELDGTNKDEKVALLKARDEILEKERSSTNREDVVVFLESFDESYLPNY